MEGAPSLTRHGVALYRDITLIAAAASLGRHKVAQMEGSYEVLTQNNRNIRFLPGKAKPEPH